MGKHYDYRHQQERLKWKPHVDAGLVLCHAVLCLMPDRLIIPGQRWHLGHTPDRTKWTGPEHEICNTTEGARRGNAMRKGVQRKRRAWVL